MNLEPSGRITHAEETRITFNCSINIPDLYPKWTINNQVYEITYLPPGFEATQSTLSFTFEWKAEVSCFYTILLHGEIVDVCSDVTTVIPLSARGEWFWIEIRETYINRAILATSSSFALGATARLSPFPTRVCLARLLSSLVPRPLWKSVLRAHALCDCVTRTTKETRHVHVLNTLFSTLNESGLKILLQILPTVKCCQHRFRSSHPWSVWSEPLAIKYRFGCFLGQHLSLPLLRKQNGTSLAWQNFTLVPWFPHSYTPSLWLICCITYALCVYIIIFTHAKISLASHTLTQGERAWLVRLLYRLV